MADPKLARTSVVLKYTGDDGYRYELTAKAGKGTTNARTGEEVPPQQAFLDALQELARITALFGFEAEAEQVFNEAREAVYEWRGRRPAAGAASVAPARPWEPAFDVVSPKQEQLVREFCAEIAGPRGGRGSPPDPVRLLGMAQALYEAERDECGPDGVRAVAPVHQNSCSKFSSTSPDDDAPLIEHQLSDLLEGIGASDDHEDAIAFFKRGGISETAAKRLVAALALHRNVPADVLAASPVNAPDLGLLAEVKPALDAIQASLDTLCARLHCRHANLHRRHALLKDQHALLDGEHPLLEPLHVVAQQAHLVAQAPQVLQDQVTDFVHYPILAESGLPRTPAAAGVPAVVAARPLADWHDDDGCVMWWTWGSGEWLGEPCYIGSPLCLNWPGTHTHWMPHPEFPPAPDVPATGGRQCEYALGICTRPECASRCQAKVAADGVKGAPTPAKFIDMPQPICDALLAYHDRPCDPEATAVVRAVLATYGVKAAQVTDAHAEAAYIAVFGWTVWADLPDSTQQKWRAAAEAVLGVTGAPSLDLPRIERALVEGLARMTKGARAEHSQALADVRAALTAGVPEADHG